MISSYDVAKTVREAIKTAYPALSVSIINLAVGDTIPAVVIAPLSISELGGSWDQPHEDGSVWLGLTCIGKNPEQTAGMQMAIKALLLQRTGSEYTTPLLTEGKETQWRLPQSLGPVVQGDNVFRTDDTYSFKETL